MVKVVSLSAVRGRLGRTADMCLLAVDHRDSLDPVN